MLITPLPFLVPRPVEILYQSHTTSISSTIDLPANLGVGEGDLLLLFDWAQSSSSTPTDVIPTDWTAIGNSLYDSRTRFRASYLHVYDAPTDPVTGMNGDVMDRKIMLQYRANSSLIIDTFTISNPGTSGPTSGTPTSLNMDPWNYEHPVVCISCYMTGSGGVITGGGGSGEQEPDHIIWVNVEGAYEFYVHDYVFQSPDITPPAPFTISMNDEGDHNALFTVIIDDFQLDTPELP